ncbi:hypothetical protein ACT453_09150, partial [Bacillus sp. D-CC]
VFIPQEEEKFLSVLKEAALQSGLLTEEQFDEIVDPKKMIAPKE